MVSTGMLSGTMMVTSNNITGMLSGTMMGTSNNITGMLIGTKTGVNGQGRYVVKGYVPQVVQCEVPKGYLSGMF